MRIKVIVYKNPLEDDEVIIANRVAFDNSTGIAHIVVKYESGTEVIQREAKMIKAVEVC